MHAILPIVFACIFYAGLVQSASIPEEETVYLSNCANCSLNLKNLEPCLARIPNCNRCMMYRNEQDPNVLEAGCCMENCGPIYQVSNANGRPTYFCQGDICNLKISSEKINLL